MFVLGSKKGKQFFSENFRFVRIHQQPKQISCTYLVTLITQTLFKKKRCYFIFVSRFYLFFILLSFVTLNKKEMTARKPADICSIRILFACVCLSLTPFFQMSYKYCQTVSQMDEKKN